MNWRIDMNSQDINIGVKQSVWEKIKEIRSENRFKSMDIVAQIFDDFFELHGDRHSYDDKAIVGGIALLDDIPVTVISEYKGIGGDDSKIRQYGMPLPEGYRKALRQMKQADKFHRPIICFIDTPGAYPGVSAEAHGQAEAIARNLYEMAALQVPVISIVVSEGGSGGALALGVANRVFMLEKATYSVVSPEGCASILWKTSKKANLASEYLRLTSNDLFRFKIIDKIISEDCQFTDICRNLKKVLKDELINLMRLDGNQLKNDRYDKFRYIGPPHIIFNK